MPAGSEWLPLVVGVVALAVFFGVVIWLDYVQSR